MEEINQALQEAQANMEKAMDHLSSELTKFRTGKASTAILNDIRVDYYGTETPLNQVANVQISDARTIIIQPWEKNLLSDIERVIINSNIGITPANDGEIIRLSIPPLTEERRKELAKQVKSVGEETKVGIRQARHKALDAIKAAVKGGVPEDFGKRKEDEVEKMVKGFVERVDKAIDNKETEIMTV